MKLYTVQYAVPDNNNNTHLKEDNGKFQGEGIPNQSRKLLEQSMMQMEIPEGGRYSNQKDFRKGEGRGRHNYSYYNTEQHHANQTWKIKMIILKIFHLPGVL